MVENASRFPSTPELKTLQGFPARKVPAKRLKVFASQPGDTLQAGCTLVKPSGLWSDGTEA